MAVYVSFVVLSALLLWAVIYARGPWKLKLVLICTVPAFGAVVWHTLEGYKGWPAPVDPPDGVFVSRLVDEPERIYVWIVPSGADRPRAYALPYKRETHKETERASQLRAKGMAVGFRQNRGAWQAYVLPAPLPPKG